MVSEGVPEWLRLVPGGCRNGADEVPKRFRREAEEAPKGVPKRFRRKVPRGAEAFGSTKQSFCGM
jgi:hypothetical protein